MEKIIIFSSSHDEHSYFKKAVGEAWACYGEGENKKKQIFVGEYNGRKSWLSTDLLCPFDLLMVWEREPECGISKEDYRTILNDIKEGSLQNEKADKLYVIFHNSTGDNYKEEQKKFASDLAPGGNYVSGTYSHASGDALYKAVASLLEGGRDDGITLEEYRSRRRRLFTGLSFPALYDQAARIQMNLFLHHLQSLKETIDPVDLSTLPQQYEAFAKSARIQKSPRSELEKEISEGATKLKSLCTNSATLPQMKEKMDDFTQHLNNILVSLAGP